MASAIEYKLRPLGISNQCLHEALDRVHLSARSAFLSSNYNRRTLMIHSIKMPVTDVES